MLKYFSASKLEVGWLRGTMVERRSVYLACTHLLMNSDHTPKTIKLGQCDLLYGSKSPTEKKEGVNMHVAGISLRVTINGLLIKVTTNLAVPYWQLCNYLWGQSPD